MSRHRRKEILKHAMKVGNVDSTMPGETHQTPRDRCGKVPRYKVLSWSVFFCFVVLFFVTLLKAEVGWKDGITVEKMPPLD